ncbi:hypothetical protein RF11_11616 [Thelohanellus kitauei]|uniref:Uncharacterized protein n=1 Tax=Thelohanellus kitauei TaxID=669202 RepID=A0A0C2N0U8_THEKT|nr:hypothetical protein RF11_11616 [Thelohanellus kitauei]
MQNNDLIIKSYQCRIGTSNFHHRRFLPCLGSAKPPLVHTVAGFTSTSIDILFAHKNHCQSVQTNTNQSAHTDLSSSRLSLTKNSPFCLSSSGLHTKIELVTLKKMTSHRNVFVGIEIQ